MQLYHALHPLTSQYAPVYPYTPSQARQLYHATRDAGLSREQIKTFSRRLHWRAPTSEQFSPSPALGPWLSFFPA